MEDAREEVRVPRAIDREHAQRGPRMHRRVHVTEAPLVRRQLAVRVHEPFATEKKELVFGGRGVEVGERDAMEAQIPRRVPWVLPLVGHHEDVVAVEVSPDGVAPVSSCRRWRRLLDVAVEPTLDVVVVVLLAPDESGEGATHHRGLFVRRVVGAQISVELVGLPLTLALTRSWAISTKAGWAVRR